MATAPRWFSANKEKAEVQRRFDTDFDDFGILINEGTLQVHGLHPSTHECMQGMHRRAWKGLNAAIQDHPTLPSYAA